MPRINRRRIRANRQNAKKSTGPRTPEGKAKSRLNALKHGILAESIVILTPAVIPAPIVIPEKAGSKASQTQSGLPCAGESQKIPNEPNSPLHNAQHSVSGRCSAVR